MDSSARTEVLQILKDPQAGILRMLAAQGMQRIGRPEDLPVLKQVATSDPLRRARGGHRRASVEGKKFYPVREAGSAAIKIIQDKAAQSD